MMLAMIRSYNKMGIEGKRIANSIKRQYIINEEFSGEDRYKLVPKVEDKKTYFAIVDEMEHELKDGSNQMLSNFRLFCDYLSEDKEKLSKIYTGINKLDLVYIGLSKNQDNPQLIFESMNSTGMELRQGDLLINYLLLDLPTNEQEDLFKKYWNPIEQDFGNNYLDRFDSFLRDYLTMLEKKCVKMGTEYEEYKEYFGDKDLSKSEQLSELRKYSKYYSRIYNCNDEDQELNNLWKELKLQRLDVANPFLMQVYNDYEYAKETEEFNFSKDDFIEIIKAINSYVYRRYVCAIPTNSLNKTFAVLYDSVDKNNYRTSVLASLVLLESYKVFPNDEDFKKEFAERDMYNIRLKNYTLEKLEEYEHLTDITVDGVDISVEHILPQTENLKIWWREVLGDNWKQLQKENMHKIGNLTLTKGVYNSEMQDLPFKEKLLVPGGIKDSHYRLSNDIVNKKVWGIKQINSRSKNLAKKAAEIWKYPVLTEEELKPYRDTMRKEKESYETMEHLPKMTDKVKNIFDKIENDIMNLDEKVTKRINKYYVSYAYEHVNFAEIIVYKNSLDILLDIPMNLIKDEKNICESIADKGHWATGDVRIKIHDSKNYEYIIDLIAQSFKHEKEEDI